MEEKSKAQAEQEKKNHIESKTLYKGRVFSLRVDSFKNAEGHVKTCDVIEHPGAVVAIPITDEGEIVLVKQWRRAANTIILELPAGTLEVGESPLKCIDRELQEEIGYKAEKITPIGGFFTAPSFLTEYLHLFLAEKLQKSALIPDDSEAIDVVYLSLNKALQMIEQHLIVDAKTIAGILWYDKWLNKTK